MVCVLFFEEFVALFGFRDADLVGLGLDVLVDLADAVGYVGGKQQVFGGFGEFYVLGKRDAFFFLHVPLLETLGF